LKGKVARAAGFDTFGECVKGESATKGRIQLAKLHFEMKGSIHLRGAKMKWVNQTHMNTI